ncbi:hypothetical protein SK128_019866 [Halocaridina rubra]|uniref:Uncharacterized protein n=1 Tax=Halocaridina rubra TaxID=373956 RepID=A0AAN8ZVD5_HALRR
MDKNSPCCFLGGTVKPFPNDGKDSVRHLFAVLCALLIPNMGEESNEDTGYGSWKTVSKRQKTNDYGYRGYGGGGKKDRWGQRSYDQRYGGGSSLMGNPGLMGNNPYDSYYSSSSYDRFYGNYGYGGQNYGSGGGGDNFSGYTQSDPYRLSRHEYDLPFGSYGSMGGGYGGSSYSSGRNNRGNKY